MHSLNFSENVPQDFIINLHNQINNTPPGEEIEIEYVPQYINITVITNPIIKEIWPTDFTLEEGNIVIPIGLKGKALEVNLQIKIHGAFKNGSISVKIHRVDLGFVSTFHKIQSLTLNEVILCIRKRCFKPSLTFNML